MTEDKEVKNGYSLSRQWFEFAFENPDKVNTNHCALWFWMIELNNQLGWKDKFGLPTYHSMEAIGVKNYKTFKKTFNDLISWNFVNLIEKAKNNHTSNVIELVKFTKADTKASLSHCLSQLPKQVQVTATIDKLLNKEETIKEETSGEAFNPSEIISYLNKKTGKEFKPNSKKTLELITARQNEGWKQEDFIKVIDNKTSQWKDDPKMNGYLRPLTLFGVKFESYLNEDIILKKGSGPANTNIEQQNHSLTFNDYTNGSN